MLYSEDSNEQLRKERTNRLQTELKFQKMNLNDLGEENKYLSQVVEDLQNKIKQRNEQLLQSLYTNKGLMAASQQFYLAVQQNRNLESDITLLRSDFENIRTVESEKDLVIINKDTRIKELERLVSEKESTIDKMAIQLVKLKNRLEAFEEEVCKFIVEKIFDQHPPSLAKITIIVHPNTGRAHLDVIVNGKRRVHMIETITNGVYDTFSSKMRDEVCTALREYIPNAKHA